MDEEALVVLREHFALRSSEPHAVMLTGGRTPLGVYRRLEQSPAKTDDQLHLLISDERHVPLDSPENNFDKIRPMIAAMKLDDRRVMRVNTELPLEAAAEQYHQDLVTFFAAGGRITLGILGLGADGFDLGFGACEILRLFEIPGW